MDTLKQKFLYSRPTTKYFTQAVKKEELQLGHTTGSRYVWTNNQWRDERNARGTYTPKFWVEEDFKNPAVTYFVYELSLPKLLFGENLTELEERHLDEVVAKIVAFCQSIGVNIFTQQILNTPPALLAIGKNITLTEVCSCDLALKAIMPFDYKPHAQHRIIAFQDYRGGGIELYFNIKKTDR